MAHLCGVAEAASTNASKLDRDCPAGTTYGAMGELLGLLHDLGKYSRAFQAYIQAAGGTLDQDEDEEKLQPSKLRGKIDHSTAGAQVIWRALSGAGGVGPIVGQVLALCVASHHSGLIDCLTPDGEDGFTRRMSKDSGRTGVDEALAAIDPPILGRARDLLGDPGLLESFRRRLAAICSAESAEGRPTVQQTQIGLLARFLFSCVIDADRTDTADFEHPRAAGQRLRGQYRAWPELSSRLEAHLETIVSPAPIDSVRTAVSLRCREAASRPRGVYTLTVPTGGGKTLASLRFALHHAEKHNMDRVIYAIPFTSIIDQNAEIARRILEPVGGGGQVVLEHHSNLTPEVQGWRGKMLSENWDAPVVFTTNVQVLEALFGAGTRGARRMHQLARAVIIFDEIQSLPVKCVHMFNSAVNFLVEQCGSTVLLCTATQPLLHRVDPSRGSLQLGPGSELMPNVAELFARLKRVNVVTRTKPGGWTNEEISTLAEGECRRTGSCLVVVNTKAMAMGVYWILRQGKQAPIAHLSTNMCPAHRKRVLKIIKHRLLQHKPILCVSTQLIEAGVDLDFGCVIRCTAGLDSIAQAAGRCNRHGLRGTGFVYVLKASDEDLGNLPDLRIGQERAERVIADFAGNPFQYGDDLLGPKAMEWYFENYFFARASEMAYPVQAPEAGRDDTLLNLLSGNVLSTHEYRSRHPESAIPHLRQSFMTAANAFRVIDAPTRGVVVPYSREGRKVVAELCGCSGIGNQYRLLRLAQQYTVSVFPNVLRRLQERGAVYPAQQEAEILCLDPRYYSSECGLTDEPVGRMEVLLS